MCVCAGIWTCCWGYSYGFKESNNSSINHCDDFHVSWRLFCSSKHIPVQKPHILTYISVLTYIYIYIPYLAESSRFHSMAKVSLLQLSHLQTSTKSAVWTHDTFSQWNRNRQWCKRSICTCSHDLWLQILGLPVSEEDETRLLKLGSKLQGLYEEKFRHR